MERKKKCNRSISSVVGVNLAIKEGNMEKVCQTQSCNRKSCIKEYSELRHHTFTSYKMIAQTKLIEGSETMENSMVLYLDKKERSDDCQNLSLFPTHKQTCISYSLPNSHVSTSNQFCTLELAFIIYFNSDLSMTSTSSMWFFAMLYQASEVNRISFANIASLSISPTLTLLCLKGISDSSALISEI